MSTSWSPPGAEVAGPPTRGAKLRAAAFRLLGLAGVGLFAYLIVKIGPGQILRALARLNIWEIAALMGLRFAYWLLRTANWRAVLVASGERVPFWTLFGARIAAYTVSYLTPAGAIGGETVRVFFLDRIGRNKTLATVIVDKTVEFLAGLATIGLAVAFLITEFALPREQEIELFAAVAALLVILLFLLLKQKKGLFTWGLDALRKLGIRVPALERRRDKIRETDAHISDFYAGNRGVFLALFASYVGQILIWSLEVYVTFRFIGGDTPGFLTSYLVVTLGSVATFLPVPGSMGVYEMAYVSLFTLLGIGLASGMAVILVRRVQGLVWAGIGLIPLTRKKPARAVNGPDRPTGPGPASGT